MIIFFSDVHLTIEGSTPTLDTNVDSNDAENTDLYSSDTDNTDEYSSEVDNTDTFSSVGENTDPRHYITEETTEKFLQVIKDRAAKLNLSTELLNALEQQHSARKSDSEAGNDVTSFLTSLLGSFLPVFDTSAINADKNVDSKIGYRKPYKIVEVENPDQIVPLEVKTGYSQVSKADRLREYPLMTSRKF